MCFPVITVSDDGDKWVIYASSALIYSITYISNNDDLTGPWIGAGEGGIFSSDTYYDWDLITPVNGNCWHIVSDTHYENFVAQCSNNVYFTNGTLERIDEIILTSVDGKNWSSWYSPCVQGHRQSEIAETCNAVQYISEWDAFVLTSNTPTGGIHATYKSDMGTMWHRGLFPYAVSFVEMSEGNDLLVSLTQNVVFSGDLSLFASATANPGEPYNYPLDTGVPTHFPLRGQIGVIGGSVDSSGDVSSNDGMDGGAIAGTVIGTIIGAIILVILCVIITLGGFVLYKRVPKSSTESLPILNDEGL